MGVTWCLEGTGITEESSPYGWWLVPLQAGGEHLWALRLLQAVSSRGLVGSGLNIAGALRASIPGDHAGSAGCVNDLG